MGTSVTEELFHAEYPADPRLVHEVRETIQQLVSPRLSSAEDMEALKVAVSEAFSNAVCHGSPKGTGNQVTLRCSVTGDTLAVDVEDQGGGFQPGEIRLPDYEEWKPSGRGLFLIAALMDDVQFEPTSEGTRVRIIKRLPPAVKTVPTPSATQSPLAARGGRTPLEFASAFMQDLSS